MYDNSWPVRSPPRTISFAPRAARIVRYLPSDIAQTHDTRFEIGSWRFYFLRNSIIIKGRIDERGYPWPHHNFFCRSPIWMLFRLYIIYFHHEKWLYQVSAPEIKYWKTSWSTIVLHTVKSEQIFFENGLSGVRLHIVGSLVDFDFVCWCSRVPAHYAMSATANGW